VKALLAITLALVLIGGAALLRLSAQQARDTIRKHHLDDIEQSLYTAQHRFGTFPPYDQPTWCGSLNDPSSVALKAEVEAALRFQNPMYGNLAKPFPTDPTAQWDYFYWKRSPAVFELYAHSEAAPTGDRNDFACPGATPQFFDYGITSLWRQA
jgi:hypothetical protein